MSNPNLLFELRQSGLLLITAFIWGCSFVAQSIGMESVGPYTFTASRMALGFVFLLPIVAMLRKRLAASQPDESERRRSPEYRRNLILGGFLCGLCLFGGEALQQFGLVHDTEVGKAGFITALYIVFVPLIGLFLGQKSRLTLWLAYTLQIVGQRGMNETAASLILSLESVFSVLAGWVVLNEILTPREGLGCVLMAVAVVLAQLPERKKKIESR